MTRDDTLYDDSETWKIVAIYAVYLAGLFSGFPFFVGAILALLFRGGSENWARTHYAEQMRQFWRVLIWGIVGGLLITISVPLMFVLIGFLTLPLGALILVWVWVTTLVSCVRGIRTAHRRLPFPDRSRRLTSERV